MWITLHFMLVHSLCTVFLKVPISPGWGNVVSGKYISEMIQALGPICWESPPHAVEPQYVSLPLPYEAWVHPGAPDGTSV